MVISPFSFPTRFDARRVPRISTAGSAVLNVDPVIDAPLVKKSVTSADGTRIASYRIGRGPRVWLMPPAMGAPLVSMKYVLERFARDYTILSWDQRGFYGSDAPRDPDAMRVDDHLLDMQAVVAAEGLERERYVLGGWSMAVQLSLEWYHRHPSAVEALVLVSGPFERALAGVLPHPAGEAALLTLVRAGAKASRVLNPLSRRILGARGAAKVLHRAGLVEKNHEFFAEVLAEFSTVDWGRYFTMTRHLHAHSAAAYLEEVRVPTLVTGGSRDLLTPPKVAERLHRAIAGSELVIIPRATHYVVAEFPDLLCDAIGGFLARVHPAAAVASDAPAGP